MLSGEARERLLSIAAASVLTKSVGSKLGSLRGHQFPTSPFMGWKVEALKAQAMCLKPRSKLGAELDKDCAVGIHSLLPSLDLLYLAPFTADPFWHLLTPFPSPCGWLNPNILGQAWAGLHAAGAEETAYKGHK